MSNLLYLKSFVFTIIWQQLQCDCTCNTCLYTHWHEHYNIDKHTLTYFRPITKHIFRINNINISVVSVEVAVNMYNSKY